MVTEFRHSQQLRVNVAPAAAKNSDITASTSVQKSLVTNPRLNTAFSSPPATLEMRVSLKTPPCQKQHFYKCPSSPQQLRSSNFSPPVSRLTQFPRYWRERAVQKEIKRICLLSLHLFGQLQPQRIQREAYKQPCTLMYLVTCLWHVLLVLLNC